MLNQVSTKKQIKLSEAKNFTLDELFDFVQKLYEKSDKDKSAKKVLDVAKEKWEKHSQYAF